VSLRYALGSRKGQEHTSSLNNHKIGPGTKLGPNIVANAGTKQPKSNDLENQTFTRKLFLPVLADSLYVFMNSVQLTDPPEEEQAVAEGKREKMVKLRRLLGEKFAGSVPMEFVPVEAPQRPDIGQRADAGVNVEARSSDLVTETGLGPAERAEITALENPVETEKAAELAGWERCSGLHKLDRLGVPEGAITEISVAPPAAGCGLAIASLVAEELDRGNPVALVDAADGFDVSDLGPVSSGRFLWIRCGAEDSSKQVGAGSSAGGLNADSGWGEENLAAHQRGWEGWKKQLSGCAPEILDSGAGVRQPEAERKSKRKRIGSPRVDQALRIADLLLRDGNLPTVILDLQGCLESELRGIPNTIWFRLRNLAEQSGVRCLAFTPSPLVSSAALRVDLAQPPSTIGLKALDDRRSDLQSRVQLEVLRDRRASVAPPVESISSSVAEAEELRVAS